MCTKYNDAFKKFYSHNVYIYIYISKFYAPNHFRNNTIILFEPFIGIGQFR